MKVYLPTYSKVELAIQTININSIVLKITSIKDQEIIDYYWIRAVDW